MTTRKHPAEGELLLKSRRWYKRILQLVSILPFFLSSAFAQTISLPGHAGTGLILPRLSRMRAASAYNSSADYGLVVGLTDPDEMVNISGEYSLSGDILVLNRGVLRIQNADFRLDGDIMVHGEGRIEIEESDFTIVQKYMYEHTAVVIEDGSLSLNQVNFYSSGDSWSLGLAGRSRYTLRNGRITDGFITVGLLEESAADVSGTEMPGEFLCFGENNLHLSGCDLILVWLVLPDSSHVEASLPSDSLVRGFAFPSGAAQAQGIPYSIQIDSCSGLMWGLISETGSQATFSNTDLRTVGLMVTGSDSVAVANVTNGSYHIDDVVNISDRYLRLVDCGVNTWSFYPSGGCRLSVSNSVFGELLAQDSSRAYIDNSICDGSGGYLAAFHQSFLLVTRSLISSQVIGRHQGVLVGAESAFLGPRIETDENAILFLANTQRSAEPRAHGGSVIFEAALPRVEGETESTIPILGTARLLSGPELPISFQGYTLEFQESDGGDWQGIGGLFPDPVLDDTLAVWNTIGLSAGNYLLRLSLRHDLGDPVSMVSWARLNSSTTIVEPSSNPASFALSQNYPNPFNSSTTIRYSMDRPCRTVLRVLDVRGRQVEVLLDEVKAAGKYSIRIHGDEWPSGIYYFSLEAGGKREIIKALLLR